MISDVLSECVSDLDYYLNSQTFDDTYSKARLRADTDGGLTFITCGTPAFSRAIRTRSAASISGRRCVRAEIPCRLTVREVLNAIFYVLSTDCQRQALPKDLPPKSTAHSYFILSDREARRSASITRSMSASV